MEIKVSVIVPIYNVEPYINRAIDSLVNQTLKDIEIILVDDGSPDNCGKIADRYAAQNANIIVIHQENGGVSDARNAGLKKATGEYIGFADPDDYAEPDMFEKLYNSAKENESDLVLCGYKEVFSPNYSLLRENKIEKKEGDMFDIAYGNVCADLGAYVWNKLYKASIIKDNNLAFPKDINIVEDTVFLFDFIKYAKSYSFINAPLYNYIRQPKSICAVYKPDRFEFYKLAANHIEKIAETFDNDFTEKVIKQNRKNELLNLLDTIDVQSGPRNGVSAGERYKEMCRLAKDEHLIKLINEHSDEIENKHHLKQIRLLKSSKYKRLFLYEFYKMRIVARIKYYIGG